MIFWLGVHEPSWLTTLGAPLMVSARRLRRRKDPARLPKAVAPWVLDSGAFSELFLYGKFATSAMQYISEVRFWRDQIGQMQWATSQDWMCEPFIIEKTGLSVAEHQRRTISNYLLLRQLAPDLPFVPVLQGWTLEEYLRHDEDYAARGVDLRQQPLVGLGSICRRQGTAEAEEIIHELARGRGLRLHGFGFKLQGLKRVCRLLASADSMAWSFAARRSEPLPGCRHTSCANCSRYALQWADQVNDLCLTPSQGRLF